MSQLLKQEFNEVDGACIRKPVQEEGNDFPDGDSDQETPQPTTIEVREATEIFQGRDIYPLSPGTRRGKALIGIH